MNILTSLAITITYMPAEETVPYLEDRIHTLGGSQSPFTVNTMKLIHDVSGGILRIVAILAWRSLLKAFTHESLQAEVEHEKMVIEH